MQRKSLQAELNQVVKALLGPVTYADEVVKVIEETFGELFAEVDRFESKRSPTAEFSVLEYPRLGYLKMGSLAAKLASKFLPLRSRRRLYGMRDVHAVLERNREILTRYGIAWDSRVGALYRFLFAEVGGVAEQALRPAEKLREENERLRDLVLELDKRLLKMAADAGYDTCLKSQNVAKESSRADTAFDTAKVVSFDAERRARGMVPQDEGPRYSAQTVEPRQVQEDSELTPTMLALGRLMLAASQGSEVEDVDARQLARETFASMVRRLCEEGMLDVSPENLLERQVADIRRGFSSSGLSLKELAKLTGVNKHSLQTLITGTPSVQLRVNTLVRVVMVLRVPLSDVFTFDDPPSASGQGG